MGLLSKGGVLITVRNGILLKKYDIIANKEREGFIYAIFWFAIDPADTYD